MPEKRRTKQQLKKYVRVGKAKKYKKTKNTYQDYLEDGDSQYKMTFQQWKKRRFKKIVERELNKIKQTNAKQKGLSVSEYWAGLTSKQRTKLRTKAKSNIRGKKRNKQKRVSVWAVRG